MRSPTQSDESITPTRTRITQGDADMVGAVSGALGRLAKEKAALLPTTVLCVEIPTNPDMKVHLGAISARSRRDLGAIPGLNLRS